MTNEQRAKEAAEKILNKLDTPHIPLWRNILEKNILAALNAATGEKDTRIKELNDALKPFAKEYYEELSIGSDDTDAGYNYETISVHVNALRTAAAVHEEG